MIGPTLRFLRRGAAPFGVSLLVHGALLALLISAALSVQSRQPAGALADLEISLDAPAPRAAPDAPADTPARGPAPEAAPAPSAPALSGLSSPDAPSAPALRSTSSPLDPLGPGSGLLRAGASAQGAIFAGLASDRAGSVVYAVDASGAMLTSLPDVINELERSINRLSPTQRFAIVLFSNRPNPGGQGAALADFFPPGGESLAPATPRAKSDAIAWARAAEPRGLSNPADGLRRALGLKPSVIFLLARSIQRSGGAGEAQWGGGKDAILADLDRANPIDPRTGRRAVAIKAVQFLEADPTGIMPAIGHAHGGGDSGYTVLTRDMLGTR